MSRSSLILKKKSWIWYFTYPFAHNNTTTIGDTVYYVVLPNVTVLKHEEIHMRQQKEVGLIKYLFLYLFCLPLFYNPWRYKWEREAYKKGTGFDDAAIKKILGSSEYGWL